MSSNPILSNVVSNHQRMLHLLMKIRGYDQNAVFVQHFVSHVRVYYYRKNIQLWDDYPFIEGCLIVYQGQNTIESVGRSDYYAYAVLNTFKSHIQHIDRSVVAVAENLNLFYLATINNEDEVFCLNFDERSQCQILDHIFQLSIMQMQLLSEIEHQVLQRFMNDANRQHFIKSTENLQSRVRDLETSLNNRSKEDVRSSRPKQIHKINNGPDQQTASTMFVDEVVPILKTPAAFLKTNSNSVSSVEFDATNRSLSECNFIDGTSSEMEKDLNERSDINIDNANRFYCR